MAAKDKWVRRFSVDEATKHKNGFTVYKISSMLFPTESPEAMSVVRVWKRYSDVQRLHAKIRALHAGLHLPGTCPILPRHSYFKRFHQQVIDERAKTIKVLLDFIAEHRMLFTSTDFVNFLQTGYPEPESQAGGVINAIRSSLQLPIEETPPLEYQTDDDDTRSPAHSGQNYPTSTDETDFISQIPIYEATDVEIRSSPKKVSEGSSFESIHSIDSIDSDVYEELNKMTVRNPKPCVRDKSVLPDLINFDAPSTSTFGNCHAARGEDSDAVSLCSARDSKESVRSRSVLSLSHVECKTRTEDSYVFEAGYVLNLAARCEDTGDYQRAFELYKSGIEKMLIGVQSDTDAQRRALIKAKTNKYLSYAEQIYKNHLCDTERSLLPERPSSQSRCQSGAVPVSMLSLGVEELSQFRLLGVVGGKAMLVLHRRDQACYVIKVIQKVPNNLTEFDSYFLQRASPTRVPTLPTLVPYMVQLHAFVETPDLMFLVLAYAPGAQLLAYARKYSRTLSPASRRVNLENVFAGPADNRANNNPELDVPQMLLNSQRLLSDVDKALSDAPVLDLDRGHSGQAHQVDNQAQAPPRASGSPSALPLPLPLPLPPSALRRWGAELLTALEALHNCGVVCRDLNPSNILLGDKGHIILTYFVGYGGLDVWLARRALRRSRGAPDLYVAPELYQGGAFLGEADGALDTVCDYWSFGAIMYELLCGVPLSFFHRSVFTSHTILQLPEGLPVEVDSLLTQLLTFEPSQRLGAGQGGVAEIKSHPYFARVDWQRVHDDWAAPD